MATKKISELEAISEAASDDVLAIVDVSETETRKITKGNLLVGAGHTIEMSLNSTTYTLTLSLKNEAGTVLNTQTIDLPNENALTNITYSNGILTLTKQNGTTSTVDISGLISGLLSETTFNAFVTEIEEIIGISTDTYRTTSTYNTGDIVIYNGKIYKCNNNNVTGTFDDTKWDEISLYEYQKLQDQKIENKVEKENGKGLSTNDYTTAEKNKLSGIETGAEVNIIETVKVNGTALTPTDKEVNVPVPTKTSDLNNDSNFGTYSKPSGGIPKTDLASDVQTSLGKADSALQEHQDVSGKEDKSNKVTELTDESTDTEYPSAKAVYDELESVKAENEVLKSEVENQQKILSQMPKVTGEGTEFTMVNTIEAQFAEFLPEGNTEQETTTGVQLFDGIVEEGSLNSGQNATGSTSLIRSKNYSAVKPNTQHAFSVNGTLNKVVMNYYDTNKNWIDTGAASGELCDTGIFTTPENAHYVRFRCYAADYNLFSTGKIQIEEGSTVKPYEKYTGGIASPNVDYPSERYSAGANGSITEKIVNKNWLVNNIISQTKNGVTFTINKDKSVTLNGTATVYTDIPILGSFGNNKPIVMGFNAGQPYTLGTMESSVGIAIYEQLTLKKQAGNITNWTPAENINASYVALYCNANATFNNVRVYPFVYTGTFTSSTISKYKEHQEQTYTMPVQQEMRDIKDSNGNVIAKDEFVEKDGVKYERHNVARVIFDGTETWVYDSTYKYFRCPTYVFDKEPKEGQEPQYSNQFIVTNDWGNTFRNQTDVNMMYHLTTGGYRVCIRNTNYDTPAGFANWLAEQYSNGTPVYVDYIVEEPTDLPCTQEQIDVLEYLPETYPDQTNVLSEDTVPANVKASGYLDLNILLNAIVALGGVI